jgi:hypothetical protein
MKHLVFTIHNGYISYHMGNNHGSHPILNDSTEKVIDYLLKIIRPHSHEIIAH